MCVITLVYADDWLRGGNILDQVLLLCNAITCCMTMRVHMHTHYTQTHMLTHTHTHTIHTLMYIVQGKTLFYQ